MGNKTSTQIQNIIRTELAVIITNNTKIINKVINDSMIEISNQIINKNINEAKQLTSASTLIDLGNIKISGKGKIDINQTVDVRSINKAISTIVNNNQSMAKFAEQATTALATALQRSQEARIAMAQNAQLTDSQKDGGGIEKIVSEAMKTVANLTRIGNNDETIIRNEVTKTINLTMESNTYNENENINRMIAKARANMENFTQETCQMNSSGTAKVLIGNIEVSDEGELKISQAVSVQAFNNCLLNTLNSNSVVADAMRMTETDIKFFQQEAQKAGIVSQQESKVSKEKVEEGSLIPSIIKPITQVNDLILYGVIGIGAIILIIIAVMVLRTGSQNTSNLKLVGQKGGNFDTGNCVNNVLIVIITVLFISILMNRKC